MLAQFKSVSFAISIVLGCFLSFNLPKLTAQNLNFKATLPTANHNGGAIKIKANNIEFDPIKASTLTEKFIISSLYDTLVNYNPSTGDIEPVLANSMYPSADRKVYLFNLQKNVLFNQSGKMLTGQDVVNSFERVKSAGLAKSFFNKLKKMEAPELFVFKLTFTQSYQGFLSEISKPMFSVIDSQSLDINSVIKSNLGSGPFKISNNKGFKHKQINLRANLNYYLKNVPFINSLKIIKSKSPQDHLTFLSIHKTNSTKLLFDSFSYHIPQITSLVFNLNNKTYSDKHFRKAFFLAINKQKIADLVSNNAHPIKSNNPYDKRHWFGNFPVKSFKPNKINNLRLARQILNERLKPHNKKLVLAYDKNKANHKLIAKILLYQFKKIGVKITNKAVELDSLDFKSSNIDLLLVTNHLPAQPSSWYYDQYHSKSPFNLSGFFNATIDSYTEQSTKMINVRDANKLAQLGKINDLIADFRPMANLLRWSKVVKIPHDLNVQYLNPYSALINPRTLWLKPVNY